MKPSIYPLDIPISAKLFIMPKPSGEWLDEDVQYYASLGIGRVVSLLEKPEAAELKLDKEGEVCGRHGLLFAQFEITDRGLPEHIEFTKFVTSLAREVESGHSITAHCRIGIGRAGLFVSCLLQELGIEAQEAIEIVSKARGVNIPDTEQQKYFILNYKLRPEKQANIDFSGVFK